MYKLQRKSPDRAIDVASLHIPMAASPKADGSLHRETGDAGEHGRPPAALVAGTERMTGNSPPAEGQRGSGRSRYHTQWLHRMLRLVIRPGARVLHVGCGCGDLLNAVEPSYGLGIDDDPDAILAARRRFSHLQFVLQDPHELDHSGVFDYAVISKPLGEWRDVQQVFDRIRRLMDADSRMVIIQGSPLWESIMRFGSRLRLFRSRRDHVWLTPKDITHLLHLAGFEIISHTSSMMLPRRIPLLTSFCNRCLSMLPGFRWLNTITFLSARRSPSPRRPDQISVSVIVPCKNECGSIEDAVRRIPLMGRDTEILFVDGSSTDGTIDAIQRQIQQWPSRRIRLIHQGGCTGKSDAVLRGVNAATGDLLVIHDADLTVPPEELSRFFQVWCEGKGDLINGSRLVYPLGKGSMQFLNLIANKFFSYMFSGLFGQHLSDTLCGTKMILKEHYRVILANPVLPGALDPFGDFTLLLGAFRHQFKVIDVPVRYAARTYGSTRIHRFRDGWLLLRMSWIAITTMKWLDGKTEAQSPPKGACPSSPPAWSHVGS